MNTIWVAGSKGQLGTEISLQRNQMAESRFLLTDIEELDLSNKQSVLDFVQQEKPDFIINGAAYTAVDKAETNQEKAYLINCKVPAFLTEAASSIGATLIHVSTDYVFDGSSKELYSETDAPNPQSVYGESKLCGEREVLKESRNLVIRTSWLYSIHGNNFVKTMLRLGGEREQIGVVSDQFGIPTSATDLASTILSIVKILMVPDTNRGGIYHYANEGSCSWYDFATEIMKIAKLNCQVNPISTEEYPLPAKRPKYSVMDTSRIKETFGIQIPEWKDSLRKVIGELID